MAESASMYVKLGLKDTSFKKSMFGAMVQVEALKKALSILSAGVKGLGGFMVEAASEASGVEESLNLMGIVFGQSQQDITSWADTFAAQTGRSTYELQGMATQLGAVLGPMLGSASATKELSTSMAALAVDVSSAMNMDEQMALDKLKAGLIGEQEPLRTLGVVMSQTALQAHALGKGINKTVKEMSESEKVSLRASFIQEKLAMINNDASNTSETYANRIRSLSAVKKDLMVIVGQSLTPVFNVFLGGLIKLGQFMLNNKEVIQSWIKTGWIALFWVMDTVMKGVKLLAYAFDGLKIVGTMAINGLLVVLKGLLATVQMVLSPFELLADALELLGGAPNPIKAAFASMNKALDKGIETTAVKAHDMVNAFGDTADAVEGIRTVMNKMKDDSVVALDAVGNKALEQVPKVQELEKPLAKVAAAPKKLSDAQKQAKEDMESYTTAAAQWGQTIGDNFISAADGAKSWSEAMKEMTISVYDSIRDMVIGIVQARAVEAAGTAGAAFSWNPILAASMAGLAFALVRGFLTKMHSGGLVTKDNLVNMPGMQSTEGLAVLEEGETVIPKNQSGGGSGTTVVVNSLAPGTDFEWDRIIRDRIVPRLAKLKRAGMMT